MKYRFDIGTEVKIPRYPASGKVVSRRFVIFDLQTSSFFKKIYKIDLGDGIPGEFPETDLEKAIKFSYKLII